jgi:hypothetical protein
MDVKELLARLEARTTVQDPSSNPSTQAASLSEEDLTTALSKLTTLGAGITIVSVGKDTRLVQSVPMELNNDHTTVFQVASESTPLKGCFTLQSLESDLAWSPARAESVASKLVSSGMAWVDLPNGHLTLPEETSYWLPCFLETESLV